MTTKTADAAIVAKPQLSPKDEVRALLDRLPDAVTLEDIQYHLDVVVKVLEAEASDPSDDIPHEEMKRQFAEMARRITWRRQARSDIASIKEYIAHDSPANATKVVAAIEQAAGSARATSLMRSG